MDGSSELTQVDNAPVPAVQQDESTAVMALISRAASDPAFDVVKLEKLMDLRDRLAANKAREAFAADFVRMQPKLPKVVRTKHNSQTKSNYAPLEVINMTVGPILADFGFGISSKVISQTDQSVTARAELWHRAGHIESTDLTMPLDKTGIAGTVNKTGPHALSSSIMYCRRIAECMLLNISTGDDNDGNGNVETITMDQAADLDGRARALGDKNHANFLKFMSVEKAIDIPSKSFKKAMDAIKEMEAGAAKLNAQKARETHA